MKNHLETKQTKEQKLKEKEIKEFNKKLKNNSKLLEDELYLFQNMCNLRLKLNQLPQKHLDNVLLMTEYFKIKRENINFKYINPKILNNRIFLNYAISENPEIYFLISEENKKIFKNLAISKDKEYLKYLTKEDFDNNEILKQVSFNLKSFNRSLSCITEDIFNKIITGKYGEYAFTEVLKLNKEQCNYLKTTLMSYIEKNKEIKGEFWFRDLLNKNPYFYTILDRNKYKDDSNKEFLISLVGKYHDLFPYLPEEWKEDLSIISKILKNKSETESTNKDYNKKLKNITLILNEYKKPEKFLETFKDINMIFIRKIYPQLTKKWREQPLIIKSLFKERDDFEVTIDYCRSIPHKELAENLVEQLKNFKSRKLRNIGETMEKVVSYYYMKDNLQIKQIKEKKIKI
jgi:hypothetical protein